VIDFKGEQKVHLYLIAVNLIKYGVDMLR